MFGLELSRRRIARFLLAAWMVAVCVLTLRPVDAERQATVSGQGSDSPVDAADFVANVTLFVPGGLLGAASGGGAVAVAAAGGGFSAAIETAQLRIPGRWTQGTDIAANAAGALIGALLWLGAVGLVRSPGTMARRLEIVAAAVLLGGHLAAVVLWSPSPKFSDGHWSREIASQRTLALPSGSTGSSFRSADPGDAATLLADSTSSGRELVRLYVSGEALVLRARVLARDLGFLQRSLRVENVLSGSDSIRASSTGGLAGMVDIRPGRVDVHTVEPRQRAASARWSLDDLWALVVPAGTLNSQTKLTLQWLFPIAFTAPLFLFAVIRGVGAAGLAWRGTGVALWVLGLPYLLGQPPFGDRLLVATAAGGGVGLVAGATVRARWWAAMERIRQIVEKGREWT